MNKSDARGPVHHRSHAHHLAAVAIGVGALLGGASVASARPIHDWVQPVQRSTAAPALTRLEVIELLPGSMSTVRDAMLGTGDALESLDSATRSLIARGRAAQRQAQTELDVRGVPTSWDTADAVVHPESQGEIRRGDAKDHPDYGPRRLSRTPIYRS